MRLAHLSSLESLRACLSAFEAGALVKAEWTHGAHVAAAATYLYRAPGYDFGAVLPLMRQRISEFNLSAGGSNTQTSGYHETLTRFWLEIVRAHLADVIPASELGAARRAVSRFGQERLLHSAYYLGDVVKDTAAHSSWREPEPKPLE